MNLTIKNITTVLGMSVQADRILTPHQAINSNGIAIAAGKAGTAGAAGVMTLGVGHGITDAMLVTLSWAAGVRYNCTVSSYDSTTITLTGGAGDALPVAGAVVASVPAQIDVSFLGTNLKALSVGADVNAHFTLQNADTVHLAKSVAAESAYQWDSGNGEANPITGDPILCLYISNRSATAGVLKYIIAYDND